MIKLVQLTILIFVVHLLNYCTCFDYCTVSCDYGSGTHTMCKYPAGGGPSCANYVGGLEADEKKDILDLHNKMRQKVAVGNQKGQPKASNMMKLEWDDELAMIAQRWSEQCELFEHDKCRRTKSGKPVGQNLAKRSGETSGTNDQITKMVQSWYKEVDDLDESNVKSYNPVNFMSIGHYTQLAWAETSYVGCGFNSDTKVSKQYMLVCNYLPVGNMMTRPMYKEGRPCSECPANTHCSKAYPGLCTKDAHDVGDGVIPAKLNGCPNISVDNLHLLISLLYLCYLFRTL